MDAKDYIMSELGADTVVSGAFSSGIEYDRERSVLRVSGAVSIFLFAIKDMPEYIKFAYHIVSSTPSCRIKLYYGGNNDFTEAKSILLPPIRGKKAEHIVRISRADSLRVDFIPEPSELEILEFKLTKPSKKEVRGIAKAQNRRIITALFSKRAWKFANLGKFMRSAKNHGIRHALSAAAKSLGDDLQKGGVTSDIQVTKPYTVTIKNTIQPDRKKVLHIIENFYTGGSSRLIIDLIEHLGHAYEQKVFTSAYRGDTEFLNIDVTVIDISNKKDVLKQINDFAPCIVHVHIWTGEWYHRVFDILGEIAVRNFTVIQNINTPLAPIERDFIDKYIFVSKYVLDNFYKESPKTQVIHPGSNFGMFTRPIADGYLPADTIGMVYRLDYDKLSSQSIDVFIRVIQKRPRTRAVIVGGGERYEEYRHKVEMANLSESFTFTGYIPYNELPGWYNKFTVFIAPVWQESFGQVSPFAMNMGIPIAGYNVGALEEIINDTSLLAPHGDTEGLADIIISLLDDYDKCVSIGRRNNKRASEMFSVEKMIEEYGRVYSRY